MSHTSTAPHGTVFIHNSDLSGEVEMKPASIPVLRRFYVGVPGADLVWLVTRAPSDLRTALEACLKRLERLEENGLAWSGDEIKAARAALESK